MISDWYFSMLPFQHLHDVIYIRLRQTNKPVTRLLVILSLQLYKANSVRRDFHGHRGKPVVVKILY